MRKIIQQILICCILASLIWGASLLADRNKLNEELIRLHVVANSDAMEDQNIKLMVRDAVNSSLKRDLEQIHDPNQALDYIQKNISKIQMVANQVLIKAGVTPDAVVSVCKEAFDTRSYDTFSLPAGVYHTLRITIGDGQGKNWWCVTFPMLCQCATSSEFEEAAVEAGFSQILTDTLTESDGFEIRFYLLDVIGKLENMLYEA